MAKRDEQITDLIIEVRELRRRFQEDRKRIRSLEKRLDTRVRREKSLLDLLEVRPRKGGSERLERLQLHQSNLEDYLLTTNERIDNILKALKNHREFLIRLNRQIQGPDSVRYTMLELDIMKNTLTIYSILGFTVDRTIVADIDRLKTNFESGDLEGGALKKSRDKIAERFAKALDQFDLGKVYTKKELPGYR